MEQGSRFVIVIDGKMLVYRRVVKSDIIPKAELFSLDLRDDGTAGNFYSIKLGKNPVYTHRFSRDKWVRFCRNNTYGKIWLQCNLTLEHFLIGVPRQDLRGTITIHLVRL